MAPRDPPAGPPVRDADASAKERRTRAVESGLDVRFREHEPCPTFDVRNPVRATRYVVVAPALPSREGAMCTCTDFTRRAIGTCKHIEAVWLWVEEHPGAHPTPPFALSPVSWGEVDRRMERMVEERGRVPEALRLRGPGGLLVAAPAPDGDRSGSRDERSREGRRGSTPGGGGQAV